MITWRIDLPPIGEVFEWRVEFNCTARPTVGGSSSSMAALELAGPGQWVLSGTTPDGTTGVDLVVAAQIRG